MSPDDGAVFTLDLAPGKLLGKPSVQCRILRHQEKP
jgi:hypothetical protein